MASFSFGDLMALSKKTSKSNAKKGKIEGTVTGRLSAKSDLRNQIPRSLISDAAEAVEKIPADELEAFAKLPAVSRDEEGKCYFCNKNCLNDSYCYGCKTFICDDCDASPAGAFGNHSPSIHKESD